MSHVQTTNPATEQPLATYAAMTDADIDAAVDRAQRAYREWGSWTVGRRGAVISAAAQLLRQEIEELALLITQEMGKPLSESRAEITKCATGLDYYAENAAQLLADTVYETAADRSWVSYEPLGVVLAVMPWNFPMWQVFRFAGPALMAGNAAVLKHSPNTTGSALAAQRIIEAAGAPAGLLTALVVAEQDVPEVTARLIDDDRIAAVTLTGSERAGAAVGSCAGRSIKKSVLELGGSDPFIVLADADIDNAVQHAVKARFLNAGQSCISPKRFIVDHRVADDFIAGMQRGVSALTVGDPEDDTTEIGPMARRDLRDLVAGQVAETLRRGADLVVGGHAVADGTGWYYLPTLLAGVRPGSPAHEEEIFGPVAAVLTFDTDEEAIRIANGTRFGLAASVWSADVEKAAHLGRRVISGACFINAPVASDVRIPFGGAKRSGYGRELADAGIREFVNARTWCANAQPL
ncbi:succinate-semialdehyde dehydrogenase / glutarate-semialdehyde dehydrogenase [Mycolicibacterium neoaurum]|uniref:NAD-dependent succinate-semialdehyde dehydrogenase n=1 Tax=Mycolicibacterium neoaurum TaxID=1795 RepID=UPI00056A4975|nr:NAD-dependent succinate-semialdehyde dehydrogenase [Mycolicibacterium neoaurum]SDC06567.1 succinate-semialdehyde dehydrogenase / glutarate-semialdehyde dehydrogenase [Mycolicibacterium neoaurum]